METQNTMEEKKTITIEEVREAVALLRTFTEQHENSALLVAFSSGPNFIHCSYGRKGEVAAALSLYAMANENVKDIILAVASMLKDESKDGEEYRARLKTIIDTSVDQ